MPSPCSRQAKPSLRVYPCISPFVVATTTASLSYPPAPRHPTHSFLGSDAALPETTPDDFSDFSCRNFRCSICEIRDSYTISTALLSSNPPSPPRPGPPQLKGPHLNPPTYRLLASRTHRRHPPSSRPHHRGTAHRTHRNNPALTNNRTNMSQKHNPPAGPPPSYPTQGHYDAGPYQQNAPIAQPQQTYAPPQEERGFFGGGGQQAQQQGYYNQAPQGQGMYYPPPQGYGGYGAQPGYPQQAGYGYGPPQGQGGYYGGRPSGGQGGGVGGGLCAGLAGLMACCCCMDMLF